MRLNRATFECWQLRFANVVNDLQVTANDQALYNGFMEVVSANVGHINMNNGDLFCTFVRRCYADHAAIAVRRHVKKSDAGSFARILAQIELCAPQLHRQFYLDQFLVNPGDFDWRVPVFESFSKDGIVVDRAAVAGDLRTIESLGLVVAAYVDRRVAHLDVSQGSDVPTFDDLESAIATLDRLVCRYNSLLSGVSLLGLTATAQFDWQQILRVPLDMRRPNGVP